MPAASRRSRCEIVDKAAAEVKGDLPPRPRSSGSRTARSRLAMALGLGMLVGAALFGAATLAFDALRQGTAPAAQHQAGR